MSLRIDLARQIGMYPSLETLKTRLKFLQQVKTYKGLVDDKRAFRGSGKIYPLSINLNHLSKIKMGKNLNQYVSHVMN